MLLHVISNYIMHGTLTQADIMEGFTALGFFGLRDAVGLLHARKKWKVLDCNIQEQNMSIENRNCWELRKSNAICNISSERKTQWKQTRINNNGKVDKSVRFINSMGNEIIGLLIIVIVGYGLLGYAGYLILRMIEGRCKKR